MISHEHKFVFIHIPKCGGTSVEWAFNAWDDQDNFFDCFILKNMQKMRDAEKKLNNRINLLKKLCKRSFIFSR